MFLKQCSSRLRLDGAKNAGRQRKYGGDKLEDPADSDTDDAEGQQNEPDQGVKDQGKQRGWPADDEKNEKEKQFHSGVELLAPVITKVGPRRFHSSDSIGCKLQLMTVA